MSPSRHEHQVKVDNNTGLITQNDNHNLNKQRKKYLSINDVTNRIKILIETNILRLTKRTLGDKDSLPNRVIPGKHHVEGS